MKNNYIAEVELPSSKSSPETYPKKLHISTLTIGALKQYALINEDNASTIIKSMLENLIQEKFDIGTLFDSDIDYLIIWLRINSFGKDYFKYPFEFICGDCGKITPSELDLSTLKVKYLENYKEINKCQLKNGDVVAQRLLTLNDEIQIQDSDLTKEEKKELAVIASTIVSVNDKTDLGSKNPFEKDRVLKDRIAYLKGLVGPDYIDDYNVLLDFLNYYSYGYEFKAEVVCPHCLEKAEDMKGGDEQLELKEPLVRKLVVVEVPFRFDLIIPPIKSRATYKDAIKLD